MMMISSEGVMRTSLEDLRCLRPQGFRGELTKPALIRIFQACDALWLHSGEPEHPHAQLTSGKCSDGFINTLEVLKYPGLCLLMAEQLVMEVRDHYQGNIDWVIGSDHAGATLSFAAALRLGAKHDFCEKGPDKTQIWQRFRIEPHEVVLQVEELVTTAGTLKAVREGVRMGNPDGVIFAPVVATLIHRSSDYEIEGAPILHLAHFDINVWDPGECPLCAAGSARLRPKQNWAELTAHG